MVQVVESAPGPLPGIIEEVVYERDDGTVYLHQRAVFDTLMKSALVELVSDKGSYKVPKVLLEPFCPKPPTTPSVKVTDAVAVFVSDVLTGRDANVGANDNEGKLAGDMARGELVLTGPPQGPPLKNNPRRVWLRLSREWLKQNFKVVVVEKEASAEGGEAAPGETPAEEGKPPPTLSEGSKAFDELNAILHHEKVSASKIEELAALAEWFGVDWAISWPLVGGWKDLLLKEMLEMETLLASLKREWNVDNARAAATKLALSETYTSGNYGFFFERCLHFASNRMSMRGVMAEAMVLLCQENEEINKLMLKACKDGWPWWEDFGRGMEVDPETGKVAVAPDEDCELLRSLEKDDADALIGWIVASKGGDFNCKVTAGTRVSEVLVWAIDDDCRTLSVLVAAAAFGCANCVRVLLSNGAAPDAPALKAALYGGSEDCIRLLQSRVQMSEIEGLQLALSCARGWNVESLEMVLNEHCQSLALDDYEELRAICHMGRGRITCAQAIAWSRHALDQAEKYADDKMEEEKRGEGA